LYSFLKLTNQFFLSSNGMKFFCSMNLITSHKN